jgi:hypothetical protein
MREEGYSEAEVLGIVGSADLLPSRGITPPVVGTDRLGVLHQTTPLGCGTALVRALRADPEAMKLIERGV